MPPRPGPNLPKSKIPAWERRRGPQTWKWNGERKGDPRLPRLDPSRDAQSWRVLLYAMAGALIGVGILFLALY